MYLLQYALKGAGIFFAYAIGRYLVSYTPNSRLTCFHFYGTERQMPKTWERFFFSQILCFRFLVDTKLKGHTLSLSSFSFPLRQPLYHEVC